MSNINVKNAVDNGNGLIDLQVYSDGSVGVAPQNSDRLPVADRAPAPPGNSTASSLKLGDGTVAAIGAVTEGQVLTLVDGVIVGGEGGGSALTPSPDFAVKVADTSPPAIATLTGAGVGAFYTADSNGALVVDGVTLALNDRFLLAINGGPFTAYAGIWKATDLGSVSTPAVWTRVNDFDEITVDKVWPGNTVTVSDGSLAGTTFVTVFSSNSDPEDGQQLDVDAGVQFFDAAGSLVGRGSIRLGGDPDDSSNTGIMAAAYLRAYKSLTANQAFIKELNIEVAPGTNAAFGPIADGELVKRDGNTFVGVSPTSLVPDPLNLANLSAAVAAFGSKGELPGSAGLIRTATTSNFVNFTATGAGSTKLLVGHDNGLDVPMDGPLVFDDVSLAVGDLFLFKDASGTARKHRGIYEITVTGGVGVPWEAKRWAPLDTQAEFEAAINYWIQLQEGTVHNGEYYTFSTDGGSGIDVTYKPHFDLYYGDIRINAGSQVEAIADPTDPLETQAAVISILNLLRGMNLVKI